MKDHKIDVTKLDRVLRNYCVLKRKSWRKFRHLHSLMMIVCTILCYIFTITGIAVKLCNYFEVTYLAEVLLHRSLKVFLASKTPFLAKNQLL